MSNTVPLVLYHDNCWDGFCAAWIAKKALGEIEAIPVQYGEPVPEVAENRDRPLYVLDFCYDRSTMFRLAAMRHEPMIVLDHHKTAQASLEGLEIELASNNCGDALTARFEMSKSGGRLSWDYFFGDEHVRKYSNPNDLRPWLVDYTEDRDLWRWALPHSREINAYIRSFPLTFAQFDDFATVQPETGVWMQMIEAGAAILRREKQIVDDHVRHAREIEMDGHKVLAVNATVLFSDIAGELAKDRPFGVAYFDRGDGKRQYSLRSRDGGVDVSEIAKAHGGGGHRNAAGFEAGVGAA